MEIPFIKEESIQNPSDIEKNFSFIVDAIFGFSFIPPLRPPFDRLIDIVARCKTRVLSIDIPSGFSIILLINYCFFYIDYRVNILVILFLIHWPF